MKLTPFPISITLLTLPYSSFFYGRRVDRVSKLTKHAISIITGGWSDYLSTYTVT